MLNSTEFLKDTEAFKVGPVSPDPGIGGRVHIITTKYTKKEGLKVSMAILDDRPVMLLKAP